MASDQPQFACIPPAQAQKLVGEGSKFLDVRTPEEFAKGAPPGAVNIPVKLHHDDKEPNPNFVKEVQQKLGSDAKDTPIVTTCYGGRRGALAAQLLHDAGFTKLHNLVGGVGAWVKEGLPTTGSVEPPAGH